MRIVFFGTPSFAVATLDALERAGTPPLLVVTQPSRPVGRGLALAEPPAARWALQRGLPLRQPSRLRDPLFLAELRELDPDVAVVVAFGRIFKRELLDLPRLGCVNLHASLLPRWRGAAPIQAAIAAGDDVTGVTTMRMEEGLDTGPILLAAATPIGPEETAEQLATRLATLGGSLLVETLDRLVAGAVVATSQDEGAATYAPQLAREDGLVRWHESAVALANRLRAYTPWPGLTASLNGRPLELVRVRPLGAGTLPDAAGEPGTVLGVSGMLLVVACGEGRLGLEAVQRPGRRVVRGADLWNGERLRAGVRFD